MKKSVILSAKLMVLGLVSLVSVDVSAAEKQPTFLNNIVEESPELMVKEICRWEGDRYVLYSRNEYRYDGLGNLSELIVSYWNVQERDWSRDHRVSYSRNELLNTQSLEYMKWDESAGGYAAATERAVYLLSNENSLQTYHLYTRTDETENWQIANAFDNTAYLAIP